MGPMKPGRTNELFSNSVRAKSVAKAKRSKEWDVAKGAAHVALAALFAPPELEKALLPNSFCSYGKSCYAG